MKILIVIVVVLGALIFLGNMSESFKQGAQGETEMFTIEKQATTTNIEVSINKTGFENVDQETQLTAEGLVFGFEQNTPAVVDHPYDLKIDTQEFESKELGTKSLLMTIYEQTGGAHGNITYASWTYDSEGEILSLNDVVDLDTKVMDLFYAKVQELENLYPDTELVAQGSGTNSDNYKIFYGDKENFVVEFPPYQIAAYAVGPQKIMIPVSELEQFLKK